MAEDVKPKYPGVVIEFSAGRRPIEEVNMRTAGFVGIAPLSGAFPGQATALFSWRDFSEKYMFREGEAGRPAAGQMFTPLAHAVYGFFLNGGTHCHVVNLGELDTAHSDDRSSLQAGLDELAGAADVAMVAAPGLADSRSYEALRAHCERNARLAILDGPEHNTDDVLAVISGERETSDAGWAMPPRSADGRLTLYVPRLRVANLAAAEPVIVLAPPSGHVAGVWARTDIERGVHKAPANEVVRGAIGLEWHVSQAEHEEINAAGVNVIREFPQKGILIWGARTLSDNPEWRYVSVRRTMTMLQRSIGQGTRWVVFEPNDEPLWSIIRREVEEFLGRLWRGGALPGRTPEEAYFVRCDGTTNSPEYIAAGEVVLDVGAALLRPAEFHFFRLIQSRAGFRIEEA